MQDATFTGFHTETLEYFAGIRFNNNHEWYEEHKQELEAHVMGPMRALAEALGPTAKTIDPRIEIKPGRCIARIRRDTRFTKDKSPYRDHLWLTHRRHDQSSSDSLAFWFGISLDGYQYGVGMYGGLKPVMDAVRLDIREHPAAWDEALKPLDDLPLLGDDYARIAMPEDVTPRVAAMYRKKGFYYEFKGESLERAMTPALLADVTAGYNRLAEIYTKVMTAYDKGRPT